MIYHPALVKRYSQPELTRLPWYKMDAIFADDIFKRLYTNEKFCISIRISLKFVPKGPIDNKSALVQAMAWRRTSAIIINMKLSSVIVICVYR